MQTLNSFEQIKDILSGTSVAVGIFDGLHIGHVAVVETALSLARSRSLQSVVLTFPFSGEIHPADKESGRRLISERDFSASLEEMGVDYLVALPFVSVRDMDADTFVREILHSALSAREVVCGDNFRFAKGGADTPQDMSRIARSFGIGVTSLPMVLLDGLPVSSTRIRDALAKGDIPLAGQMLGCRYSFSFEASCDSEPGITVINQIFPVDFMKPRLGVYASSVIIDGRAFSGATTIGYEPDAGNGHALAETRIADFEGDLNGRNVKVELISFFSDKGELEEIEGLARRTRSDCEKVSGTFGGLPSAR